MVGRRRSCVARQMCRSADCRERGETKSADIAKDGELMSANLAIVSLTEEVEEVALAQQ